MGGLRTRMANPPHFVRRRTSTSFRSGSGSIWLEIDQEWNSTEEQPGLIRSSRRDLGLPCE
ncbi:MAG: hypothetical protein DSY81_10100 [Bacillota bacterium]|nr:MAG: hypothetical protein DSY92_09220 [Planctomycetota bacterium]RUA08206.1 MAG: hypothetical protein DSY81_10100 [Bacillota bacterium]